MLTTKIVITKTALMVLLSTPFMAVTAYASSEPGEKLGNCEPNFIRKNSLFDDQNDRRKLKVLVTRFSGSDSRSEILGADVASNLALGLETYLRDISASKKLGTEFIEGIQVRYVPCMVFGGHDGARQLGQAWGADLVFWGQASCPITKPSECHLGPIILNSGTVINKGNISTGDNSPVQIGITNITVKSPQESKEEGAFKTSLTVVRIGTMRTSQKSSVPVQLDPQSIQNLDFPRIASAQPITLFQFFLGVYGFLNRKYLFAATTFKSTERSIGSSMANQYQIYSLIGASYLYVGKLTDGFFALNQAIRSCPKDTTAESIQCRARTTTNLGWGYAKAGRHSDALALYEDALRMHKQTQDIDGQITTLNNMGFAYQGTNRVEQALVSYKQALTLAVGPDNIERRAALQNNIASILLRNDLYSKGVTQEFEVIERLQDAARIYESDAVNKNKLPHSAFLLSCTTGAIGGRVYIGNSQKSDFQLFDSDGYLAVKINLAEAYQKIGEIEQAYSESQQARLLARESGDRVAECLSLARLRNYGERYYRGKRHYQEEYEKDFQSLCRRRNYHSFKIW